MFDVLVIGSGSGGAPCARGLAEAGARVCVIEAGGDPAGDPAVADPLAWFGLQTGAWDWGQAYAPQAALGGRTIPIPRGRALGGCSATNAMMWYRGTPADYDGWDLPGWAWADCLPAFRAIETAPEPAEGRGDGGPMRLTRGEDHPLNAATLQAAMAMGLPRIEPNSGAPRGVMWADFNIHQGRRFTSADAWLRGSGITLMTGTRALQVLFQGTRATGVRVATPQGVEDLHAPRIVLAGGALETPRLLMLSGIGPAAALKALGLPCRIDAPEVGQNLQDHPLLRAVNFRSRVPMSPQVGNGGGTMLLWPSDPGRTQSDLLAFPIQNASGGPDLRAAHDLSGEVFAYGLGVMRSWSRGRLSLTSAEPDAPLHIQPNLLSDPRDRAAMVQGLLFLQETVEAHSPLFAGHLAPKTRLTAETAEGFIRLATSTFFHCCGTARMGADSGAVCDPRLRVNGAQGLWIADASVMPLIPACHTHAPTTMIGHRAAQFLCEAP